MITKKGQLLNKLTALLTIAVGVHVVLAFLFAAFGYAHGFMGFRGLANFIWDPTESVTSNPEFIQVSAKVSWSGDIENFDIDESSGLASSLLHPDTLWTINDSGSEPILYALSTDGRSRGQVYVETEHQIDWESLGSFRLNDRAYLAIGDTGDNFRWRREVAVIIVPEPELTQQIVKPEWEIRYRYPDEPRDSEALAVDAVEGKILVVSKRMYPPRLFTIPLQPTSQDVQVAQEIGALVLPRPTALELERNGDAKYRHMPSGMDLTIDDRGHRLLLITTYRHAYLYDFGAQGFAMNKPPWQVLLPRLGQREAIAFLQKKANTAYVSKERFEGTGIADLFRIDIKETPQSQDHESRLTPAGAF
ncbi:MAG: hypothetical protein AAF541_21170 [Pseudomonadota bacterium]